MESVVMKSSNPASQIFKERFPSFHLDGLDLEVQRDEREDQALHNAKNVRESVLCHQERRRERRRQTLRSWTR